MVPCGPSDRAAFPHGSPGRAKRAVPGAFGPRHGICRRHVYLGKTATVSCRRSTPRIDAPYFLLTALRSVHQSHRGYVGTDRNRGFAQPPGKYVGRGVRRAFRHGLVTRLLRLGCSQLSSGSAGSGSRGNLSGALARDYYHGHTQYRRRSGLHHQGRFGDPRVVTRTATRVSPNRALPKRASRPARRPRRIIISRRKRSTTFCKGGGRCESKTPSEK